MSNELTQKQKDELEYQQALKEFLDNGGVIEVVAPQGKK